MLVLCADSIYPMTLIACRPIGMIRMTDGGKADEKIIAVPINDPTYGGYGDIGQLPAHIFDEMMHFFAVYKELEHKVTAVQEVCRRDKAEEIIDKCIHNYKNKYGRRAKPL